MNQLVFHLAATVLALAAFLPTASHGLPILLLDSEADRVGAAVQPCLASTMKVLRPERIRADTGGPTAGADEALVWLLLTGGAGLLAFARRGPAAHGRTGRPGA